MEGKRMRDQLREICGSYRARRLGENHAALERFWQFCTTSTTLSFSPFIPYEKA